MDWPKIKYWLLFALAPAIYFCVFITAAVTYNAFFLMTRILDDFNERVYFQTYSRDDGEMATAVAFYYIVAPAVTVAWWFNHI